MSRYLLIPYPHIKHVLRRWGQGFFFYCCPGCLKALEPCVSILRLNNVEITDIEEDQPQTHLMGGPIKCDLVECDNLAAKEIYQRYGKNFI